MSDDAMDLVGRRVPRQTPPLRDVRTLDVPSRVVRRREVVLAILDAAYRRDTGPRELG